MSAKQADALAAIRERDASTPSELAAIHERAAHGMSLDIGQALRDCRALADESNRLTAEVDRLTLAAMSENDYLNGQRHERARILAEVRAVEWVGCGGWGCATRAGEIYDAVIAAIEGDTT